jgi:hypothetical protein
LITKEATMAVTPGELAVTLPIFTEVNGTRYELGTFNVPVRLKVTGDDGHTLTLTGEVGDPQEIEDDLFGQLVRAHLPLGTDWKR